MAPTQASMALTPARTLALLLMLGSLALPAACSDCGGGAVDDDASRQDATAGHDAGGGQDATATPDATGHPDTAGRPDTAVRPDSAPGQDTAAGHDGAQRDSAASTDAATAQDATASQDATTTPDAGDTLPAFTTDPTSATVVAGAIASFAVVAAGSPAPTLAWQRSDDGGTTWNDIAGATAASYTTDATVAGDDGAQFRAVATNRAGSATSAAATLTVHWAPSISQQPASQTVVAPASATFTVVAGGHPAV
ncbi:MAG: hypothetical protein JXR83_16815, partial [Deltaproteobacteria bacterium]|nr:hypothetical protein [Deltaproteobacteria bacterium]